MARTAIRPYVDRIMDGGLDQALTNWRAEGLTAEAIANRLAAEHGIDVSYRTVYRWLETLDTKGAA